MRRNVLALLLALLPLQAMAQDRLISGPGSTLTENKCKICHELQHIRRSPLSRDEWWDNLRNMKERGTPMNDEEMKIILEYLAVYYNREKPAPEPSPDTLVSQQKDPLLRMLDAHACNGCHALDKRVVGPSFREIAAKYRSDPKAASYLAAKIRAGGQGAWGQVPMPPNASVTADEASALAAWVLQQK